MVGAKLAQYSMSIVDLAIKSIPVPFAYLLNFSLPLQFDSKRPAVPQVYFCPTFCLILTGW